MGRKEDIRIIGSEKEKNYKYYQYHYGYSKYSTHQYKKQWEKV